MGENRASRLISRTQAPNRSISIAVGDHARILAVVCFCFFLKMASGAHSGCGDVEVHMTKYSDFTSQLSRLQRWYVSG